MKSESLYTIFFLLPSFLFSQPIIDESETFEAGDQFYRYTDNQDNVHELGSAGANQVWNFSQDVILSNTGVFTFLPLSDLPGPIQSIYPNASMASDDNGDGTSFAYWTQDATGLYFDGLVYNYQNYPDYQNTDFVNNYLLAPYPFTYGDSRSHTYQAVSLGSDGQFDDSYTDHVKVQSFDADGHGTLITLIGSYSNILRVKREVIDFDSTYTTFDGGATYQLTNTDADTTLFYDYFQNAFPQFLASVRMMTDGIGISRLEFFSASPLGLVEDDSAETIRPFPNPSSGDVFLTIDKIGIYNLSVLDMTGRLVHYGVINNSIKKVNLRLNFLDKGHYQIILANDETRYSGKILLAE